VLKDQMVLSSYQTFQNLNKSI